MDRDYIKGIASMATAAILLGVMATLLRFAGDTGVYTAALFRFVIGMLVSTALVLTGRDRLTFNRGGLLILRGTLGGIGVVFYYLCIQKIGLAKGTVLAFCYPVFAAIFGAWFLKEKVNVRQWLMIATAFCGILLTSGWRLGDMQVGFYEGLAIVLAAMAGAIVVIIRALRRTDSVTSIFGAQCVAGFLVVVLPARVEFMSLEAPIVWVLVGSALAASAGQLAMTYAYTHVSAATGSVLGMLTPVIGIIFGIALFNEPVTARALLGAAMIFVGCVGTAVSSGMPVPVEPRDRAAVVRS